ncbi:MAG: 3-dehydroquinate synthase [Planctomycetes bacterium]|nr:3-dehydroquinate synthase [Planctomycetota bacterium]
MPSTLRVDTEPSYEVRVGAGVLSEAAALVADRGAVAVLVDERVAPLHLARLGALADAAVVRVRAGEAAKTFAELERVLDALVAAGLDRRGAVLALGGGATCDLAGLAAALYMRGVDCFYAPTTLLAQVDASVGGKTAVNLAAGKNLAGTFHQPRGVLADVETLATLPAEELRSGLGEVLKSALLAGEADLAALERDAAALARGDAAALEAAVVRAVAQKARVVAADPREAGARKQLNLGHTWAHAVERLVGFGRVPHGLAVAAGLGEALTTAAALGVLADPRLVARARALAGALGLPADLAELEAERGLRLPRAELHAAMATDKKNVGRDVRLVLLRRAGEPVWDVPATF